MAVFGYYIQVISRCFSSMVARQRLVWGWLGGSSEGSPWVRPRMWIRLSTAFRRQLIGRCSRVFKVASSWILGILGGPGKRIGVAMWILGACRCRTWLPADVSSLRFALHFYICNCYTEFTWLEAEQTRPDDYLLSCIRSRSSNMLRSVVVIFPNNTIWSASWSSVNAQLNSTMLLCPRGPSAEFTAKLVLFIRFSFISSTSDLRRFGIVASRDKVAFLLKSGTFKRWDPSSDWSEWRNSAYSSGMDAPGERSYVSDGKDSDPDVVCGSVVRSAGSDVVDGMLL